MSVLLPLAIFLLPLLITAVAMSLVLRRNRRFVNPLTKSLARPPGTQLARQLAGEQTEVGFGVSELLLPALVPMIIFVQFKERILLGQPVFLGVLLLSMTVWGVWVAIALRRLLKRFGKIRVLRLAYECELAVGQELDQLMRFGFRVFHDVQADKFNVDHFVVGPAGVFAVETKGRSKRSGDRAGAGKTAYRVSYQRGILEFPGWSESEPPKQAARQAVWAGKWLSEAVGFAVPVKPVVVLPGWYIENKDNPAVPVIASGFIEKFFRGQRQQALSAQQIEQISYQINQKVRDLPPGEIARALQEA